MSNREKENRTFLIVVGMRCSFNFLYEVNQSINQLLSITRGVSTLFAQSEKKTTDPSRASMKRQWPGKSPHFPIKFFFPLIIVLLFFSCYFMLLVFTSWCDTDRLLWTAYLRECSYAAALQAERGPGLPEGWITKLIKKCHIPEIRDALSWASRIDFFHHTERQSASSQYTQSLSDCGPLSPLIKYAELKNLITRTARKTIGLLWGK